MNYHFNVLFFDNSQQNVELTAAEFKKQGFNIVYRRVNTCWTGLMKIPMI